MSSEQDLRVMKTLTLIKNSFVELMDEKGFRNITVNDISNKAMISRSTFYLHYADKYELLDKVTDEAISSILNLVKPEAHIFDGCLNYDGLRENLNTIFHVMEKDALLYKFLLNDNEHMGLCRKCEDALKTRMGESFTGEIQVSRDLFFELMTSTYISMVRWWLNHEMKYSSSFLAKEMVNYLTAVPCNLIGISTENSARAISAQNAVNRPQNGTGN
ncbi:TetR/AcrR family transcriptional regulator C-terminal domain-containing protein [Oscillibacter sp.]|uniref:TetR/AcrR family transcriptional regulator n=1 Tax=Oscillibacter sp. TaxID=1945593 RepID=UPI00289E1C95|nr:TetR/AcrR family transcriptional regulator C-terminal domain-containing protein [Oscillibacter sp.]